MFIKIFATFLFLLYLLVAFVWPTVRTYMSTGINPVTFGGGDNVHDYIGRWFKVIIALIPVSIAFYWMGYDIYLYLLPVFFLEAAGVQAMGASLLLLSLMWTAIAQFQMGNSWRIGLDNENRTDLVQHGLFSKSRNPVFLGMVSSLAGFFMLLPNALTFLVLITGCLLIQIQVRLEEEFLTRQFGSIYKMYCARVRRFL